MRSRFLLGLNFVALGVGLFIGSAAAQERPPVPKATKPPVVEQAAPANTLPSAPVAPTAQASETEQYKLLGFRSALFGMDEAETRAAIIKDFAVDANAIHKAKNLAERTEGLGIKATDVLKDGGSADIAYILGYKSKKLVQINIVWSTAADKDMTPERMLANAEALRTYFLTVGYVPNTVVVNSATREGILLFRGADAEGHTAALLLQGTTTVKDKASSFVPNALMLFYLQDTKTPDVFKISAGKF